MQLLMYNGAVSIRDMKKKYKILLILVVIVVVLFAISKPLLGVRFLELVGLRRLDALLVKITCMGENKQYMTWGFLANPVCATTYPDSGKPCKSSNECLSGLCVRTQNIKEPYCRGLSSDFPLC